MAMLFCPYKKWFHGIKRAKCYTRINAECEWFLMRRQAQHEGQSSSIHAGLIEVFYLPIYSPERNPEERLNADLELIICKKCPCVPWQISLKLRAQFLPR